MILKLNRREENKDIFFYYHQFPYCIILLVVTVYKPSVSLWERGLFFYISLYEVSNEKKGGLECLFLKWKWLVFAFLYSGGHMFV
ncbi:hypothetical protein BCR42DRAFT_409001 [Absidia repens]|uniref:Uncharacterized protein n=1 Tax=Absidia repens TaxID=90262 RepID=A0A1X2IQJ8_9FUNG|nr:hypothetical protein BCR42DRAFT_409001 [Absidia repens]